MIRTGIVLLTLLAALAAQGEERILDYAINIAVEADGGLQVTENITIRAEGNRIRRGIYRDFPTRYRDRYGNRVIIGMQVLGVDRDDRPEPWFTEAMQNGIRINTGNDDFLPVPAEYTYTLRYRTTRQLGYFAYHDELYWNAIGTGWIFPIDRGSVEVRLPSPVPFEQMHAEGYTGYQGERGQDYQAALPAPGIARWQLTRALNPEQGLTIVLTFPKGLVPEPTKAQSTQWFLADNSGVLVALIGLLALLVFCTWEWRRIGRDPARGIVIARYEPPVCFTPAGLRYLRRMSYDTRCFSSELLALAVAGHLTITREQHLLKDAWQIDYRASQIEVGDCARVLLAGLFPGGKQTLALKNTNASIITSARWSHRKALNQILQPRFFKRNGASFAKAIVIGIAAAVLALVLSGGAGIPVIAAISIVMLLVLIVFGFVIRAPTAEGRNLLDEIEGLKLYLSVAERDELARMQGPDQPPVLDAKRYELLLPYAVALEVEDAWTDKFTAAAGAAAATAAASNIVWYRGGRIGDLGSLSRSIGNNLSSQIASSSTPPGSTSGSGGGGSSGGGGGGGGGGGR